MLYTICREICRIYFRLFYKVKVNGIENIPKEGGAIICPNHFSYADPVLVAIVISRKIRFMAKNELFKNAFARYFLTKWGVYPVKRGEADLNAIKITLKSLKSGQLIGIFPEGTRVKGDELGKANPGVAMFSIKSSCPVIPAAITGSYKFFTPLTITFGQPMDLVKFKKDKMANDDYLELSQMIMDKIRELKRG